FSPFLKLRMAAPRSPPALRSFLVPKTSTTTTSTTNQCQILKLPIALLPRESIAPSIARHGCTKASPRTVQIDGTPGRMPPRRNALHREPGPIATRNPSAVDQRPDWPDPTKISAQSTPPDDRAHRRSHPAACRPGP